MKMILSGKRLSLALAGLLSVPSFASAADSAVPRDPDVRVENVVHVRDANVVVRQVRSYKGEALVALWGRLDADGNGRIAPDERKKFQEQLPPLYTDSSSLRINWQSVVPARVTAESPALPVRKPRNLRRAPAAVVTLEAVYESAPSKADILELSIPGINASDVQTRFVWDEGFVLLRANMGEATGEREWSMTQKDGAPAAFSAVIHRKIGGSPAPAAPRP